MRDPSDLMNTLESSDERLDRALRKISGLDQLVKEGNYHHLMPGLTKSSIPDPLFTTPDVGGAQATFTKGLWLKPGSGVAGLYLGLAGWASDLANEASNLAGCASGLAGWP